MNEIPNASKTSGVLAEQFLKDSKNYVGSNKQVSENHIVPNRHTHKELEAAFSRIFSKEKYGGFSEFIETFNEPGLERLEHIIPHIIMVHPEKTDKGHVGEIRMDPQYNESTPSKQVVRNMQVQTYRPTL